MFRSRRSASTSGGQALVEFALIILVLLFIIFVLIEGARLFQANQTVQNAARAAGRYAITGQYDPGCLANTPPCDDPRVESIQAVAEEELAGLRLDSGAEFEEPHFYLIEVKTPNEEWQPGDPVDEQWVDGAGESGDPVLVRVTYREQLVTPLLRPMAETVAVSGQVIFNNENFDQRVSITGVNDPPDIPPPPDPPEPPPPADLELSISESANRVVEGESFSYQLVVFNAGGRRADVVELTNTLPSDASVDSVTTDVGSCGQSGGTVTCQLGTLDPAGSATVNIHLTAGEIDQPEVTITNSAIVDFDGTDADPSNNEASEDTTIVDDPDEADVRIEKVGPAVTPVDEPFNYTLNVINEGLSMAQNVQVSDTLPGGVTFNAGSSSTTCDVQGSTVTFCLGDLPRGSVVPVYINVTPHTPGTLQNQATVQSDTLDPDPSNNTSTPVVETEVVEVADMWINKVDSPDPVPAGGRITYSITVGNDGPQDATGVSVDDALPYNVRFESVSLSQGDPSTDCTRGGNVVTCNLGDIPSGGTASMTIVVTALEADLIVNRASVAANEEDLDQSNNEDTTVTAVYAQADLIISKEASPEGVNTGQTITYTMVVTNNGPSPTTGVVVEDDLPANTALLSATASQGNCTQSDNPVVCSLGTLDVGAVATVIIRVTPTQAGTITNYARTYSEVPDPAMGNNSDAVETEVGTGSEFITVSPICGESGTLVSIQGYGFRRNKTVDVYWDVVGGSPIGSPTTDASGNFTLSYTIPASPDGMHTIFAREQNTQVQTQFRIPCPKPNLVIGPLTLLTAEPITQTEPVEFRTVISNTGELDANSQFFVGLYFDPATPVVSTTQTIAQEDRVGVVAISSLAVGESRVVILRADSGFAITGTHSVYGVVDSDPAPAGRVDERYETDNVSPELLVEVQEGAEPPDGGEEPPQGDGVLAGAAYVVALGGELIPQAEVEVSIWEITGTQPVNTTYTNSDGFYSFSGLHSGPYVVQACITIDNTDYYYEVNVPSVNTNPPPITEQDLFLDRGTCPR